MLKFKNVKISDGKIADTTFIGRIFGGYLRNELKCLKCNYSSQTFNHFLDLSLEITKGISTVTDAIKAFTAKERLDCGNEWKCEKCKMKVQATKQLMISSAPVILTIHLKRFNYNGKINKQIGFNLVEEVPCIITAADGTEKIVKVKYHLYAFIVHHGHSTHSGHYVAYVKAPNDQWCEMNDSTVSRCSSSNLFKQEAYVLFYRKEGVHVAHKEMNEAKVTAPTPVIAAPAIVDDVGTAVHKDKQRIEKAIQQRISQPDDSGRMNGISTEVDDDQQMATNDASTDSTYTDCSDDDIPIYDNALISTLVRPRCFLGIRGKFLRKLNLRLLPVKQLYAENRKERNKYMSLLSGCKDVSDSEDTDSDSNEVVGKVGNTVRPPPPSNADMKLLLVNEGKRGKVVGSEGFWTFDNETAVDKAKREQLIQGKEAISKKVMQQERSQKRAVVVDEWDERLDQGRMKKVKGDTNEDLDTTNYFQMASNKLHNAGNVNHANHNNNMNAKTHNGYDKKSYKNKNRK